MAARDSERWAFRRRTAAAAIALAAVGLAAAHFWFWPKGSSGVDPGASAAPAATAPAAPEIGARTGAAGDPPALPDAIDAAEQGAAPVAVVPPPVPPPDPRTGGSVGRTGDRQTPEWKLEKTRRINAMLEQRIDRVEREARELESSGHASEAAERRVVLARLRAQLAATMREADDHARAARGDADAG